MSIVEGTSLLKSKATAVEYDVCKITSTVSCLEPKIETLRQSIFEVRDSVYELQVGWVEGIIRDAIHILTWPNTTEKVAENVIQPKEENDEHDIRAAIFKESQKRKCSRSPPISLDNRLRHHICHKITVNKVDHMAYNREKASIIETIDMVEEVKLSNKSKKFPLMGNISPKDTELLKFLLWKSRKGGHKSREEVAHIGEFKVSHEDIQCLWASIPISVKVINIWAAYLCQAKPDSWFLSTSFGEQACSNVSVSITSTIGTCGLQRFHRRLKHCVEIFIPLHDEIANHWFLLVMKLQENIAEVWDSVLEFTALNRRLDISRASMLLLQKVFGNAMTKSSNVFYNFPSFDFSFPEGNPITEDKYDSGIYIMMQMKFYSEKWFEGYNMEVIWSAVALEIVNNPSNELLKYVITATMKSKDCRDSTCDHVEAIKSKIDVATNCESPMKISQEKPNGRKCRSHRKRRSKA